VITTGRLARHDTSASNGRPLTVPVGRGRQAAHTAGQSGGRSQRHRHRHQQRPAISGDDEWEVDDAGKNPPPHSCTADKPYRPMNHDVACEEINSG